MANLLICVSTLFYGIIAKMHGYISTDGDGKTCGVLVWVYFLLVKNAQPTLSKKLFIDANNFAIQFKMTIGQIHVKKGKNQLP